MNDRTRARQELRDAARKGIQEYLDSTRGAALFGAGATVSEVNEPPYIGLRVTNPDAAFTVTVAGDDDADFDRGIDPFD